MTRIETSVSHMEKRLTSIENSIMQLKRFFGVEESIVPSFERMVTLDDFHGFLHNLKDSVYKSYMVRNVCGFS
jgi:hypothetical protein